MLLRFLQSFVVAALLCPDELVRHIRKAQVQAVGREGASVNDFGRAGRHAVRPADAAFVRQAGDRVMVEVMAGGVQATCDAVASTTTLVAAVRPALADEGTWRNFLHETWYRCECRDVPFKDCLHTDELSMQMDVSYYLFFYFLIQVHSLPKTVLSFCPLCVHA